MGDNINNNMIKINVRIIANKQSQRREKRKDQFLQWFGVTSLHPLSSNSYLNEGSINEGPQGHHYLLIMVVIIKIKNKKT